MILLNLPRPPSTNKLYRNVPGKGRVKTERYKTWLRAAGNELIAQRQEHIGGEVSLYIDVGYDINKDGSVSKRRMDLDNFIKATQDLLVKHHMIDDDAFVLSIYAKWTETVSPKRMSIAVSPVVSTRGEKVA